MKVGKVDSTYEYKSPWRTKPREGNRAILRTI